MNIQQEIIDAPEPQPVGYLYTNVQSGEYHVSDYDDDYRGPERALWHIEPVYRRTKGTAMSEHTKELIRELDAIRGSAKLCPSGAQGQAIGQETWRITLSGNSLQSITDAVNKLNEFERQRDALLAALENLLSITSDSEGVAGYYLNGAVANWDEFPEVNEAALLVSWLSVDSLGEL